MRKSSIFLIAALAFMAAPAASWADGSDDLSGLEMDAQDANGTPNDQSTKTLSLPDEASDTAREHAQKGLDAANSAREDGAGFGEDAADAARDSHSEAGSDNGKPSDVPGRP